MHRLAWVVLALGCSSNHRIASTADAPEAPPADAPAAPPDGPVPTYQGLINLQSYSGGGGNGYGYAVYFMAGTPGGVFCYTGTAHGDCCVLGTTSAPAHVSAGTLTISNTTQHQSGTMMWDAGEQDYDQLSSLVSWSTGDTLTVAAAGETVPGFTATTKFPVDITGLVTPAVSLSHDWTVTWTPGGATTMEIYLSTETSDKQVACHGPDSAGQLTLPSALLAELTPGNGVMIAERKNYGLGDTDPAIILEPEVSQSPSVAVGP